MGLSGGMMQTNCESEGADEAAVILRGAIDCFAAADLVRRGELQEAEDILCREVNPPDSVEGLDLLARIAVQRGQFARARGLWRAALEKDGTNETLRSALARLDQPWLAFAIARRLGILTALAIGLALAAVGLLALSRPQFLASPAPSVILLTPSREQHVSASRLTTLVPQPQPTSTNAQGNSDARLEPETPRVPPLFSIAGATVSTNNTELRIIFDEGLFAYRCELTESARTRLETVGRAIRERAPDCWVIVEGHTDSDPLPPNSDFKDNFTLGLHRALAAAEVLKARAIPPQEIFVASGGDQAPVFPGDGYETKLKNRTVVIRLLPKATGEPRTGESRQ
jgi:flagellar motor protein MotB